VKGVTVLGNAVVVVLLVLKAAGGENTHKAAIYRVKAAAEDGFEG